MALVQKRQPHHSHPHDMVKGEGPWLSTGEPKLGLLTSKFPLSFLVSMQPPVCGESNGSVA
jgi:hypothetical protein